MYVLEPGETEKVESATADPIGLKIGIVYEAETEVLNPWLYAIIYKLKIFSGY